MTVKELKNILYELPDDLEVRMLTSSCDNVNESFQIENVVSVTSHVGDRYANELVLIPE